MVIDPFMTNKFSSAMNNLGTINRTLSTLTDTVNSPFTSILDFEFSMSYF